MIGLDEAAIGGEPPWVDTGLEQLVVPVGRGTFAMALDGRRGRARGSAKLGRGRDGERVRRRAEAHVEHQERPRIRLGEASSAMAIVASSARERGPDRAGAPQERAGLRVVERRRPLRDRDRVDRRRDGGERLRALDVASRARRAPSARASASAAFASRHTEPGATSATIASHVASERARPGKDLSPSCHGSRKLS